jgi:hypothetical protein
MQGTWSRASAGSVPPDPFPQPTDFALNGVRCTGSLVGGASLETARADQPCR